MTETIIIIAFLLFISGCTYIAYKYYRNLKKKSQNSFYHDLSNIFKTKFSKKNLKLPIHGEYNGCKIYIKEL